MPVTWDLFGIFRFGGFEILADCLILEFVLEVSLALD